MDHCLYNVHYTVLCSSFQNIHVNTLYYKHYLYIPDCILCHSAQYVCYMKSCSDSDRYSCWNSYIHRSRQHTLYHTCIPTTQHRTLRHIDQSRDYRDCCLYNVLNTYDCNYHRTILLYILFHIEVQAIQFYRKCMFLF